MSETIKHYNNRRVVTSSLGKPISQHMAYMWIFSPVFLGSLGTSQRTYCIKPEYDQHGKKEVIQPFYMGLK